jgi:hypothetical protein
VQQPVQLAAGVRVGLQRGQDPVPDALAAPAVKPAGHRLPGTKLAGQVPPRRRVQSSHMIASTIRRWSFGGRPIRGRCGGSSGASLAHCASVSSRVVRAMGANSAHLSHQHCKHALGNARGRGASRPTEVLLLSAAAAFAIPTAVWAAEALPAVESESASPGLGHRGLLGHRPYRLLLPGP